MSMHAVELRDQLSIDTPELVSLELPVAGLGSRAVACFIDYLLQSVALFLFFLGLALLASALPTPAHAHVSKAQSDSDTAWGMAIVIAIMFLFQWGYFTLFEAFWHGQTPGKRLLRLRVLEQTGRSASFLNALTRNLLRVVDMMPGFYLVGIVFLFATKRSQRLGDLTAGTIVVHERTVESPMWDGTAARHLTASLTEAMVSTPAAAKPTGLPADKITRLTLQDVEVMESFEARRLDLPLDTATALAEKLAAQMAAKMEVEMPAEMTPATFLERLAVERRSLGRGTGVGALL